MVNKGFIHIANDWNSKGVKLYCPPFKSELQFSRGELETTRRIASARIHVERKMEQINFFRILQGIMPLAISDLAEQIFFVCAALTNLLPTPSVRINYWYMYFVKVIFDQYIMYTTLKWFFYNLYYFMILLSNEQCHMHVFYLFTLYMIHV